MLSLVAITAVCLAIVNGAPVKSTTNDKIIRSFLNGHQLSPQQEAMCKPYNKAHFPAPKQQKARQQGNLCAFTYSQYQVVTALGPQVDAPGLCEQEGLVWAGIDAVDDVDNIADLLDDCDGAIAHIAYYQGIYPTSQPDVCLYVNNDDSVDFLTAPNVCSTAPAMALCSAVGVSTIPSDTTTTTTDISSTTISSTSIISTTTTSFTITTTAFTVTEASVRTLTSTTWSPVIITLVSTTVLTETTTTGTETFTFTTTTVSTTVTTIDVEKTTTITQTVLPTCPGQRLDTCPCYPKKEGYVVISNPLPYVQAKCACESLGLDFADVTESSLAKAKKILDDCIDCRKSAWIASWEGINNDECLALYSNGNIAVPENCNSRRPVLCKVVVHDWSSSDCGCHNDWKSLKSLEAGKPAGSSKGCGKPDCGCDNNCGCPSSSSSSSSCEPCKPCCEPSCPSSSSSSSSCEPCKPCCEPSCPSSSSSSSSCEPCCPPPVCPCECDKWTEESCSTTSEWEACDECQVCCCNQVHRAKYANVFAGSRNNNFKQKSAQVQVNKNPTRIEKAVHQFTATFCVQTSTDYSVIVNTGSLADLDLACQAAGGVLADLSESELADLAYLFSVCNLQNGAYINSFDELGANPCGYVYLIPNIFGYVRYEAVSDSCSALRGAICKASASTTVTFGSLFPSSTTTTEYTSTSVITTPTTTTTTTTTTTSTTSTSETTFIVPDISYDYTSTSTTVTTRTSPSSTTLRTSTTTTVTEEVEATETVETTPEYTGTTVVTELNTTGTTTTTTTVTLVGKSQ